MVCRAPCHIFRSPPVNGSTGQADEGGKKRVGEQRYGAVGIPREDMEARQRAGAANGGCFGAPTVLGSRTPLSHSLCLGCEIHCPSQRGVDGQPLAVPKAMFGRGRMPTP